MHTMSGRKLERLPIFGGYLRKKREIAETEELLDLTQAVTRKINDQLKQQVTHVKFADTTTGTVYLEKYSFGLLNLGDKRTSVSLLVAHKPGVIPEYYNGHDLSMRCLIQEDHGFDEKNRFLEINQRRNGDTNLKFTASIPLRDLTHGAKITFLNDLLMMNFDETYTQELLDRDKKEDYNVSLILNNTNVPTIIISSPPSTSREGRGYFQK